MNLPDDLANRLGTTMLIHPGKKRGVHLDVFIVNKKWTSAGKMKLNDRDVDDLIVALLDAKAGHKAKKGKK